MDFLDPKKRRAHTIRLFVGYCLVATALLLGSILLLFAAFGYGINRTTGEVIQNGLLFVDAHPQAARMYINGQDKGETDGRFVLEANTYNLELKRDGYRSWKRDFTLEGGNIVRLVYPFLFPEKLTSKDVQPFAVTPDVVTESPDRRWIVIHDPSLPTTFKVVDTSTKDFATTSITIPEVVLNNRPGALKMEFVEWSTDNRHVLLKNTYQGGYDYLVIDRIDATAAYNATQVFNKQFSTITFRDKKSNQLYLHDTSSGELFSGSVQDKALTAVATDVLSFWPYKDNTVVYTTGSGATTFDKVVLRVKEGQVTYTIRELLRADGYLLNMAEFDNETYVVGGSKADGKVYIYKNPVQALKDNPATTMLPSILMRLDKPELASFSNNARFLAVQSSSKFAVYDFETEQKYTYDTKIQLPTVHKASWMDGHRLMLVGADNKLTIFDYDGLNAQQLVTTDPAFIPLFDRDYNQLFTVSPLTTDVTKQGLVWTDLNLGVN